MPFILNNWREILDPAPWSERRLMRSVSVGNYIYMTGGTTAAAGDRTAEVWRTQDGITWELLTDTPGWSARCAHGFIYWNNKFWVIAGSENGTYLNDVWSSDDCITWENVANGVFGETRHEFGLCIHGNTLIVSGGFNGGYLSNVYSTEDGITWTKICDNIDAARSGPREHWMISYRGALWIYAGENNIGITRRMYRSTNNGVTWNDLGVAAFAARREIAGLVDENGQNLAIIGGYTSGPPADSYNDVWETDDGSTFTEITQINAFTKRSDFSFVHHLKRLYIFGGTPDSGATLMNDVWISPAEPGAYFSGDPTSGLYPLTVEFENDSVEYALSYLWDFGDGNTSTEESPTHRYDAPGTYTVSLTSTYLEGSDKETKVGYITVTLNFTGSPLSGNVPLKVRFNL